MANILKKKQNEEASNPEDIEDAARYLLAGVSNLMRVASDDASRFFTELESNSEAWSGFMSDRHAEMLAMLPIAVPLTATDGIVLKSGIQNNETAESIDVDGESFGGDEETLPAELRDSRNITQQVFKVLDDISSIILSQKLPGESAVEINTGTIILFLHRELVDLKSAKYYQIDDGTWFKIPPSVFESLGESVIDTQIYSTPTNPFTWHSSGYQVKTSVIGLSIRDTMGDELRLVSLDDDIEMFIPRNEDGTLDMETLTTLPDDPNIMIQFNLSESYSSIHIQIHPSNKRVLMEAFLRFGFPPDDDQYDLRMLLPFEEDQLSTSSYNETYTATADPNVWFIEEHVLYAVGTYYLSVKALDRHGEPVNRTEEGSGVDFDVKIYTARCLYWADAYEQWLPSGCKVGPLTTTAHTHCKCNHLTAFGGNFHVPVNDVVAFDYEILHNAFEDNVILPIVVCVIVALYIVTAIIAVKADHKYQQQQQLTGQRENPPLSDYQYTITMFTGMHVRAGTTAQVSVQLIGSRAKSNAFTLSDSSLSGDVFQSGSVDTFQITTSTRLGQLLSVRIWHDGNGFSPSWLLSRVMVEDSQSNQSWYFLCNQWQHEEYNPKIYKALDFEEILLNKHLFAVESNCDVYRKHLTAIKLFRRRCSDKITYLERVTCLFAFIFTVMLILSFLLYGPVGDPSQQQTDNKYAITADAFIKGILGGIISMPVHVMLLFLFQNANNIHVLKKFLLKKKQQREKKYLEEVNIKGKGAPVAINVLTSSQEDTALSPDEEDLQKESFVSGDFADAQSEAITLQIPSQDGKSVTHDGREHHHKHRRASVASTLSSDDGSVHRHHGKRQSEHRLKESHKIGTRPKSDEEALRNKGKRSPTLKVPGVEIEESSSRHRTRSHSKHRHHGREDDMHRSSSRHRGHRKDRSHSHHRSTSHHRSHSHHRKHKDEAEEDSHRKSRKDLHEEGRRHHHHRRRKSHHSDNNRAASHHRRHHDRDESSGHDRTSKERKQSLQVSGMEAKHTSSRYHSRSRSSHSRSGSSSHHSRHHHRRGRDSRHRGHSRRHSHIESDESYSDDESRRKRHHHHHRGRRHHHSSRHRYSSHDESDDGRRKHSKTRHGRHRSHSHVFLSVWFGLHYGKSLTLSWIISVVVAVLQLLFITEPLATLFIIIFSVVLTKRKSLRAESLIFESEYHQLQSKDKSATGYHMNLGSQPDIKAKFLRSRCLIQKHSKMRKYIKVTSQWATIGLFFLLVMMITYGQKEPSAYYLRQSLYHSMVNGTSMGYQAQSFEKVNTASAYWRWTESVLLPALYSVDSEDTNDMPVLMTSPRLRQLRINASEGDCEPETYNEVKTMICYSGYSEELEDTTQYLWGWQVMPEYYSLDQTKGYRYYTGASLGIDGEYTGLFAEYSGGGYVADLTKSYHDALILVRDLQEAAWIDTYTRAVFMECALFSVQTRLVYVVTLLAEMAPSGDLVTSVTLKPLRLYLEKGTSSSSEMILVCTFTFLVLVLVYLESRILFKEGHTYFLTFTHAVDILSIIVALVAIGVYFIHSMTLSALLSQSYDFFALRNVAQMQENYHVALAILVFCASLKLLNALTPVKYMSLLLSVWKTTMKQIMKSIPMVLFVFVNFLHVGFLLYSGQYIEFHSVSSTVQTLLFYPLSGSRQINPQEMSYALSCFFISYLIVLGLMIALVFYAVTLHTFRSAKLLHMLRDFTESGKISATLKKYIKKLYWRGRVERLRRRMEKQARKMRQRRNRLIMPSSRPALQRLEDHVDRMLRQTVQENRLLFEDKVALKEEIERQLFQEISDEEDSLLSI
ncbi:polycystin-1-like protein 2 [Glandiceps talaboti]